jgi:hypothetical protein
MVSPGSAAEVVDVAPHDVAYDSERQLWYADIEVNAGASYFPMIRLALAKYQPISVAGAHLSNIVLADVIALTPDRWLSVTSGVNPAVRDISVFGFTFSDSSGHTEAASAPSTVILNRAENPVELAKTSVVEVWIEKLDPALGEDLGWKHDSSATVTVATPTTSIPSTPTDTTFERQRTTLFAQRKFSELAQNIQQFRPVRLWPQLWTGSVTLPASRQPGDRYRIVIAEFEEYIVDDATPYDKTPSSKDRRMVFFQHIPFS